MVSAVIFIAYHEAPFGLISLETNREIKEIQETRGFVTFSLTKYTSNYY